MTSPLRLYFLHALPRLSVVKARINFTRTREEEELTDQDNHSSEDSEEEPPSSRGQKGGKRGSKIKLIKLNKNLGKDEKESSVEKGGKTEKIHGNIEKIVGATQKFGELFFYVKLENKAKPVFVRAEENECIFWLLIGNLRFFRELKRIFIYLINLLIF